MNLPEWVTRVTEPSVVSPLTVFSRLLLALAAGALIAVMARWSSRERRDDTLPFTLMLMAVLIAMATQIICDNIARAFSLVGALSIVRFRTAVPTTGDVAYVLASVVVGMAIGAGQLTVGGLGLTTVLLAVITVNGSTYVRQRSESHDAAVDSQRSSTGTRGRLTIQSTLSCPDPATDHLGAHCLDARLEAITTVRKGASLQLTYEVDLRPECSPQALINALNRIAGIESLAWQMNNERRVS
ncbi:MAG: DUF4956 domain-containing protein [Planctomycetaceae bacterium]|nr:DUF4956 domain-containing protein [Planctomycetaceae bacterium]